jgi:hypothetical protein
MHLALEAFDYSSSSMKQNIFQSKKRLKTFLLPKLSFPFIETSKLFYDTEKHKTFSFSFSVALLPRATSGKGGKFANAITLISWKRERFSEGFFVIFVDTSRWDENIFTIRSHGPSAKTFIIVLGK